MRWKFIDVDHNINSLNKIILIGIIIAIVTVGIIVSYTSSMMTGQTENQQSNFIPQPQTSGRNVTINLQDGLNLRSSP